MTIEVRVPISPTPSFLNRAILLAASIRRFYPDTIVRVYVGQEGGSTPEAAARVREAFTPHDISWEWVPGRLFDEWQHTRSPYLATMNQRWRNPADGDFVLIADADVICVQPFPELLEGNAVCGTQAHTAPLNDEQFRYLFTIVGCQPPVFEHRYTGSGFMGPTGHKGPFYPNSGFVLIPRVHFEAMRPHYTAAVNLLKSCMTDTYWFDQLCLSLSGHLAGVPMRSVALRFNFPNDPRFDDVAPEELNGVRVLHYLREWQIDRNAAFTDLAAIRRLVTRDDLEGSNEVLRRTVAETMGCLEPRALNSSEEVPWA